MSDAMTTARLKQADRVRWRLLSEHDRHRLVQICQVRNQKMSTVLRICARRYKWDIDAYCKEARVFGVIKLPKKKDGMWRP